MTFASVYPLYVAKIERKGRTKKNCIKVIEWLTGFDEEAGNAINEQVTLKHSSTGNVNPKASLITGLICGYRIEEIENQITKAKSGTSTSWWTNWQRPKHRKDFKEIKTHDNK